MLHSSVDAIAAPNSQSDHFGHQQDKTAIKVNLSVMRWPSHEIQVRIASFLKGSDGTRQARDYPSSQGSLCLEEQSNEIRLANADLTYSANLSTHTSILCQVWRRMKIVRKTYQSHGSANIRRCFKPNRASLDQSSLDDRQGPVGLGSMSTRPGTRMRNPHVLNLRLNPMGRASERLCLSMAS